MSKHSEAVKRWRRSVRQRLVDGFGGACACCGYAACIDAMELHHIDPSQKEFSFGACIANPKAWSRIVAEAAKCIMLCCRCHREVHAGQRVLPVHYTHFTAPTSPVVLPSLCPQCGGPKHAQSRYCSRQCSGLAHTRIDWTKVDLERLLVTEHRSYCAVAELVGISDVAVRKRARKLGIVP